MRQVLKMRQAGFAYGKDVEPYFNQLLMIEDVSAVKDEGRFVH